MIWQKWQDCIHTLMQKFSYRLRRQSVLLVQPAERVVSHHLEVHFRAHKIPDVFVAVLNHRRPNRKQKSDTRSRRKKKS